ncbi:MAG TPA: hypothetical protein VIZ17_09470, partial [Acetobacteraceae bacterium]
DQPALQHRLHYQSVGRLSSVTYASQGWKYSYTRDSAGQVSSIIATQPAHSAVNLLTSILHMPFGRCLVRWKGARRAMAKRVEL